MNQFCLKKNHRVVYPFPWVSKQEPCPWKQSTHMRVIIPLTESEKIYSHKKAHTQIVRRDNIQEIGPQKLKLRKSA